MQDAGPPLDEQRPRDPISFGPRAIWVVIGIFAVVVALFAAWIYLNWSIAQHVYSTKSDLSWFGITFYHDYTFLVGGILALLVVNPRVGKSDLGGLVTMLTRRTSQYSDEIQRPLAELHPGPGSGAFGSSQSGRWSSGSSSSTAASRPSARS